MGELKDRVVVITGAARGMGAEYVKAFIKEEAKVVATDVSWLSGTRSHDDAAAFKKELGSNKNVLTLDMDVTDDAQLQAALKATLDAFGTVDVLVNNGAMRMNAMTDSGRLKALDIEKRHWEQMFKINVLGLVETTRVFAKPMMKQNRGSIINISSGSGDRPPGLDSPYSSSKAAVTSLTKSLAIELKENNIAANAVYPSQPRTTGYEEQANARRAMGMRVNPPSRPDAMVPLVLFFAQQDANSGVTGKVLSATEWNWEHGLGGPDKWVSPE